jgi:small ligand-binding sensory domain FIST
MHGPFLQAHATHPDGRMALALVAAQIDAQRAARPDFAATLGLLYLTDALAHQAAEIVAEAEQRWPGVAFAGTVGVGVCASGVEYDQEPALVLLMMHLPREQFRCFHGRQTLAGDDVWTALVHADPSTPDLPELLDELANRTETRYLFGGLTASRTQSLQWSAGEVFGAGLSGVAFMDGVSVISRVTQGCQPLGPTRSITEAERNVVITLDGQPALPLLLADAGVSLDHPREAMRRLQGVLVGLTDANDDALGRGGQFGADTRVRHLIGFDPARDAVAVAGDIEPGMQLAFCDRHVEAARRDLVRICAEIREEVEAGADEAALLTEPALGAAPTRQIAGAIYVSCSGRGGSHFGGPSAELRTVRQALGDVPLVGFFAAGEIARHHLYGYTGVLTVFVGEGSA